MKDYLSSSEREKYLTVAKLMDGIDEMILWADRGVITKEERKNLKMASTLIYKSLDSIIDRLNPSAKRTMANAMKDSVVLLDNNFGLKQYLKKKKADEKLAFEENEDYFNLVEEVAFQNCNGCKKHCTECRYYELWEELYISDMGANYGNCRFAYDMPVKKEEKIEK